MTNTNLEEEMEDYENLLIILVSAAFVAALLATIRQRNVTVENWRKFAMRRGLNYSKPVEKYTMPVVGTLLNLQEFGSVSGEVEGAQVNLYSELRGSGKSSHRYTILSLSFPGIPQGLVIFPENVIMKLTKAFGAQDILTGDPEFDAAFIIKGEKEGEVLAYLTHERRRIIMKTLRDDGNIAIREAGLIYEKMGVITDMQEIEKVYEKMMKLLPDLKPADRKS